MEAIFMLVPVSIAIVFLALIAFVWSVSRHQFDDLEKEAERILIDEDVHQPANSHSTHLNNHYKQQPINNNPGE